MDSYVFLVNVFIGLGMGMLYALMGLGQSLIWGSMKLLNIAQGEFFILGSYMLILFVGFGIPIIPALALSMVTVFVFAAFIERILIHRIHVKEVEKPFQYTIIVTLGLSMVLINLFIQIFGPWPQAVAGDFLPGNYVIGIPISGDRLFAIGTAILLVTALILFLQKTWTGKALRAVAQSKIGASVVGINIPRYYTLAFALSGLLAAAAGGLLTPIFFAYPTGGQGPMQKGWIIIVLGGMGSITGSVLGGLILGLIEVFGAIFISPMYTEVYGFIAAILILVLKPSGLMGEKVRKA